MKSITKQEMDALIKSGIIVNSSRGLVSNRHNFNPADKTYNPIGFYRTKNNRYVEEWFATEAKRIVEEEV